MRSERILKKKKKKELVFGFEVFGVSLFLLYYYFQKNNCSCCCLWRLRRTRNKHPKTSSATIRRWPAARPTSTPGRCRSASRCLLETTCWCPQPSSPTTRPTSWSGCSLRRRLELCECQISCSTSTLGLHSCQLLPHREMGSNVDADLPEVSPPPWMGEVFSPAGADGVFALSLLHPAFLRRSQTRRKASGGSLTSWLVT